LIRIELKEFQETIGGFDDVVEVPHKVDSFGGDGKTEIFVTVDHGNRNAVESEFHWITINADDAAFRDVELHPVLLGPTFGDTEKTLGGFEVVCEEGSVVGIE
jgi:hypothetical protein